MAPLPEADRALVALLDALRAEDYHFVTVTPETHRRFLERDPGARARARDLRDIFGWSRPFDESALAPALLDLLRASGTLRREGGLWKSGVRVSRLAGTLFVHSAYPTDDADSVFLGPDSYRFAAFLHAEIPDLPAVRCLADIGAGAGIGAIAAAPLLSGARLVLTDVNPVALRFARINAHHAGLDVDLRLGSGLAGIEGEIDLVIANPPFVMDPAKRAYRDGGDREGAGLSLDWARQAMERVAPGGAVLLYSGSAIVAGRDRLREALAEKAESSGWRLRYAEIDPDIFGELLSEPAYREVERVAAIGAVLRHPRG
jgi:methylase of polypeptide subunit release factors